jgi:cardiolipin synthase
VGSNVKKYKLILLILLALVLMPARAFCYQGEVEDVSGGKYYPAVKKVLDNSAKSIFMVMYIVNLDARNTKSLVYKLCRSLVSAQERGVKVRVILDQNIDFKRGRGNGKWQIAGKNENAFRFFKGNNINVFYDDVTIYAHNKAIVVDNEILILGSTNWSDSALRRNNETSVLIRSKELAESYSKKLF